MGLTIHYNGSLRDPSTLSEMIMVVKEVAEAHNWPYTVFEEKFPEGSFEKSTYDQHIYGILFTPPNCESVSISFLSNGKMCGLPQFTFFTKTKDRAEEADLLHFVFVKTQFAGAEIHKIIIKLFKYLNEKYFNKFKVRDEGEYWETGDEKLLDATFKRYTDMLNGFSSSLEEIPKNKDETLEDYLERLAKLTQQRRSDKK